MGGLDDLLTGGSLPEEVANEPERLGVLGRGQVEPEPLELRVTPRIRALHTAVIADRSAGAWRELD
jgi:hypothetical protein